MKKGNVCKLLCIAILQLFAVTAFGQPAVPVLSAATNTDCSSFIANWNSSAGATAYYLEVSTSTTFTTFVGIYNPVSCGNNLTYFVAGLSASTTYYYRVSASNGSGNSGYTAGVYTTVTTLPAAGCSTNSTWLQVGSAAGGGGVTNSDPAVGSDYEVAAMCNDCKDNKLFAGGYFTSVNNTSIPASCVATWTPSAVYPYTSGTWASIGTIGGGLAVSNLGADQNPHEIYAMVYYQGIVYIGGNFTTINGSPTDGSGKTYNNLAQYNVSSGTWSAVGGSGGITGGSGTGYAVFYSQGPVAGNIGGFYVQSLAVDNSGRLYVGGNFTKVAGASTDGSGKSFNNIAMWNGSTWSALGGGMTGTNSNGSGTAVPTVYSLDVLDSVHVYAGGQFKTAGVTTASNIAMWNGTTWSALGNGIPQNAMGPGLCGGIVSGTVNWSDCPAVLALANVGTMVYAAGVFNKAGTVPANNIAQWNQSTSTWADIGGVGGPTNDIGEATALYANNNILYIGGDFQNANNCILTVNNVAAYDGASWILLPASAPGFQPGLSNVLSLTSLTGFPSPGYSILFAGGDYEGGTNAPSDPSVNHIAQYPGLATPVPVLTVTPSVSICAGGSTTLTASGAITYTWSPGTGLSSTTGSSVTANPTVTTTYTVTGTNSSVCNCGCTQSATVTVTVTPGLTVTASATAPSICSGGSTTLNAGGATTYTWSPGTGLSSTTGASVTATPGSTITYTVTGTTGGCTGTATVAVTVTATPTVTAVATSPSICSGSSTTINAGGATSYTWSPGTGLSSTTGSPVTANPATTTTYTVTGTTGGCTGTQTVTITVTPTPTVSVTPPSSTLCSGNSVGLSATGATSYTWSPPGGLSCTSCPNPTANPGSTVTYTVTGTTAGCTGKDSVLITVNPTPTLNVTPASPILCGGGSTSLTASGATTYTWSPGTGLSSTTGAIVTANPGTTTTYTVTGTIGTCTGTATVTVTVAPTPTVNVTPSSSTICSGNSVSLSATGATSYTWSPPGGLSCTSCPNPTANPGSTVTYTVTGTTGGCTSKDSVLITVNPTPTLNVTPSSASLCSGGSVGLSATGATSYTWSPPGGLSCTSCPNPTANPGSTVTYTVTGTTGGCNSKDSVLITVTPTPTLSVTSSSPSICSGNSTSLSATGATSYTWSPPGGLSCTSCPNPTANPGSTVTYTVVGTTAGCTGKDSVTVTVNPTPTVTATTGVLTTICAGDSILLQSGGATTYSWNPAVSVACPTCQNTNAGPATTTTYTVTGTTNGCSSTASVQVTVNPTPTVTAVATIPTLCSGGSTSINASGATTYTWSPPTGLSSTTGASVTATPATTTTYTVVGTNGSGCLDSTTVTVTVTPTPTLTVTPPSPGICGGDSVTMTAGGATTYTWSPGTGLSATTGAVVTATPGTTTTYTITGSNGACSSTQTVTITVGALVVTATPGSPTICSGSSTTITATGAVTYTWSPGSGLSSTTGSTVTANPGSTTTYTVVGSSGAGCKDSSTVTISVTPTPTLTVTPPSATICNASSTLLTASGATTYTWLPAAGLTCTNCPNPTASPGSTVTYTVTGTTGGCTSKDSVTITIDNPAISISTTGSTICNGSSAVLTASGGTSYLWSPSGGLSCTSCFNPTANPGSTTTYTVVGTDGLGCKDSSSVTLTVNPKPIVSVTAIDSMICQGNATTLTASGASSYTWTPGTGLGCTNCTSTSANPSGTTTYTVIGTSAAGCGDTANFTLTVNPTPTVSISLSTGSSTICSGQSVTLTASGSVTYKWSTGSTASSITVTPAGTTTYSVKGSNGTCADSSSVTISLYPAMVVTMSANDSICVSKTGQVSVNVSGGNPPYTYSWNNGLGTGSGPFTVNPSIPTYYVCTVSDGCGSTKDSTQVYTFSSSPEATFTAMPNSIVGGQFVSFINTSTGASSYLWNLGNGNTSTDSSVYYQYLAAGNYTVSLIVTNKFGCTDTAYDTIHVTESITVPNVFTPNGDGYNDVFHVTAGGFETYFIEIFNRWGEKVFEANSPDIDWNGRSTAGVEESDGTYYYIIKTTGYDGKANNLTGYIQLIR